MFPASTLKNPMSLELALVGIIGLRSIFAYVDLPLLAEPTIEIRIGSCEFNKSFLKDFVSENDLPTNEIASLTLNRENIESTKIKVI